MTDREAPRDWMGLLGTALVLQCALTFGLGMAWLSVGGDLAPTGAYAVALVAFGGTVAWTGRGSGRTALPVAGMLMLCWAGAMALASSRSDVSADGQGYHQEAVLALRLGWNPIRREYKDVAAFGPEARVESANAAWIGHYPRAAWVIWSVAGSVTGSHEAGKAVNLVLILASFLMAASSLRIWDFAHGTSLAIAATAALNPVSLVQAMAFYLDGICGSLLLCLCAGLAAVLRGSSRTGTLGAGAALAILVNAKFTMVPMAGVLGAATLAATYLAPALRSARGDAWRLGAVGALSVVLLGFSPYVANLLSHGHPFHPAMGPHRIALLEGNVPQAILSVPGPLRMFASMMAESSIYKNLWNLVYKAPFTYNGLEFVSAGYPDTRTGGFGVLFSGVLCTALATGAYLALRRPASWASGSWIAVTAGVVFMSAYINPEAWWARYVPQFWLVPALAAAAGLASDRAGKIMGGATLAAMLACAYLSAASAMAMLAEENAHIRAQDEGLVRNREDVVAYLAGSVASYRRMTDNGIGVTVIPSAGALSCPAPETLAGTFRAGRFCRVSRPAQ